MVDSGGEDAKTPQEQLVNYFRVLQMQGIKPAYPTAHAEKQSYAEGGSIGGNRELLPLDVERKAWGISRADGTIRPFRQ